MVKFGKEFDGRKLKRTIDEIRRLVDAQKKDADRFYNGSNGCKLRCRVCNERKNRAFLTALGKYHYYECLCCGSIYMVETPQMGKMYGEIDSANGDLYIDPEIYDDRVINVALPKVRFVEESAKNNNIIIKKWFDVGCGGGDILYSIKKYTDIIGRGIDSDSVEVDFARKKGLEVKKADIGDSINGNMKEEIYESDAVSLFNVIEHLEYPRDYIKKLSASMRYGALLVVEVPRHPSLASFVNYTNENAIYRHIVPPIHLQIFSDKGIEILLGKEYSIISRWEFGQGFSDMINYAMYNSGKQENNLYHEIVNAASSIQNKIDELGLADQMLIVARKIRD